MQKKGKVVLIGLGYVGTSVLNSLLRLGVADEIAVINRNKRKAEGAVLDASHTLPFNNCPNVEIKTGEYEECADAQVIIIAAGPSIKPGERDRSLVLKENIQVITEVMEQVVAYTREAKIIIISNPNDLLVYIACRRFQYPSHLVMGTGTLVDTARLNKMLADLCGVDPKNVNGFVLGEHGSASFIPWNTVNVACVPMDRLQEEFGLSHQPDCDALQEAVRKVGFEILDMRGYTSWGVALSACRITESIIRNTKSVLPVSTVLEGAYGISDIAMSLPCILGENGVERILHFPLDEKAQKDLQLCVAKMKEEVKRIRLTD